MRIYQKDGRNYISVTSIIDLMFGFDEEGFKMFAYKQNISPEWINKESIERGNKYHAYFENRAHGITWADKVDDQKDLGYREAVDKFFKDGWEILECEREVYNDEYLFAGRFDCLVKKDQKVYLADIKSWGAWSGKLYKKNPDKLKKVSNQLSMYNSCLEEQLPLLLIVPQSNGEYITENILPSSDWRYFLERNKREIESMVKEYIK